MCVEKPAHIYARTQTHTHRTYAHHQLCVCLYVCFVCVYVCLHICEREDMLLRHCMFVCMYPYQNTTPHIYTCIHTHTYAHNAQTHTPAHTTTSSHNQQLACAALPFSSERERERE